MNLPTLETISRKSGVSESQISRILSGISEPSWSSARKIAIALKISLDDLAALLDSRKPKTKHPVNKDIEENPGLLKFRLDAPKMSLWPMVQE